MYGLFAACFSLLGLFLPTAILPNYPLESATIEHVVGHIVWGMMIAFVALSLRYIVAGGLFAIILDADHLVGFLTIESVSRMSHSIPFALLIPIVMMLIFGRRDFILGSISFAAVFSHLSFDTLFDSGDFPILIPFSSLVLTFQGTDWIILQLIAVSVVICTKLITEKKGINKKSFQESHNQLRKFKQKVKYLD